MNYIELMIPIVQQAGQMIAAQHRKPLEVFYKPWGGVYTALDVQIQQFLVENLTKIIPHSGVIAEEQDLHSPAEYTWVIDPIDGTRNFIHGLPYCGVSVALMHHQQIIAAVVHMPFLGDTVYAQKGYGCWLNGQRVLSLDQRTQLQSILVGVPSFYVSSGLYAGKIKQVFKQHGAVVSFRTMGAAALDLAYVAAGVLDGTLLEGCSWWDVAAGIFLVQEAGGVVVQYDGNPVTVSFKTLVAARPVVYQKIQDVVQEAKK